MICVFSIGEYLLCVCDKTNSLSFTAVHLFGGEGGASFCVCALVTQPGSQNEN